MTRTGGRAAVRQVWWSLLALLVSVGIGVWLLDFVGVIDVRSAVMAQLRRLPVVADYIIASERVRRFEQAQQAARAELDQLRKELERERQALDARAAELAKKERELQLREADLERRAQELARREQELSGAAAREQYYRELVEAVAQMRPEEAAPIIEQLDLELARRLLGSMEPRQAGAILGRLDPQHASRLLAALNQPEAVRR